MRNVLAIGLAVALSTSVSFADKQKKSTAAQEKAEAAVQITMGPKIEHITGTSAVVHWATDRTAANQVKYRSGNDAWKNAFKRQGTKDHYAKLTGLKPNETVEYQILTRDGDVRKAGSFKTAATPTGTMPDLDQK